MSRYANFQCLRVSQIAACNRFHEIEQRLARWLLMSQDRVGSASLPFTHEFLASMLGTGPSDAKSGRLPAGNWVMLSTPSNLPHIGYQVQLLAGAARKTMGAEAPWFVENERI
ncbi:MAG: hypothetical protein DMG98_22740 [Acidobacteria bacterium]|nr:MAG: hypothetical protein DMG98_22740 [Acidobacteriota bacterium]